MIMERIIVYPNTTAFELIEKLKPIMKEQMYEAFKAGFVNGNLIETKYFNDNKDELIKVSFELYLKLDTDPLEVKHLIFED